MAMFFDTTLLKICVLDIISFYHIVLYNCRPARPGTVFFEALYSCGPPQIFPAFEALYNYELIRLTQLTKTKFENAIAVEG